MFYYVPLEQLHERYTEFLSGPFGIVENQLQTLEIPYKVIRPDNQLHWISAGRVLDPVQRTRWGFAQTLDIVERIQKKEMTHDDVIYFEDFWHPGFEMIPYTIQVVYGGLNAGPRLYSFCHAQSVDPHDFTHAMKDWMRAFEVGWAKVNQSIYVAAPELRKMLEENDVVERYRSMAVGTIFDSSILQKYAPGSVFNRYRSKAVIFSSRWDTEKNPDFFMKLVREVAAERTDIRFIVCSGFSSLRSNNASLAYEAEDLAKQLPNIFSIWTGLSKSQYYYSLMTSGVQFNCADQDFVSYTLLEAATFGCAPLYPRYLTFTDALHREPTHLYEKNNLQDAKEKLYALIDKPVDRDFRWIYRKYEDSFKRILRDMGYKLEEGVLALPAALRMSKEQITQFYKEK